MLWAAWYWIELMLLSRGQFALLSNSLMWEIHVRIFARLGNCSSNAIRRDASWAESRRFRSCGAIFLRRKLGQLAFNVLHHGSSKNGESANLAMVLGSAD